MSNSTQVEQAQKLETEQTTPIAITPMLSTLIVQEPKKMRLPVSYRQRTQLLPVLTKPQDNDSAPQRLYANHYK